MAALVLWLLAGCGDGSTTDLPHPTGHRDVVLRIVQGPGTGTSQGAFSTPPVVVVTGDATMYLRTEERTMSGIVWPLVTRPMSEGYLQTLLHRADSDGLLAEPPDYSPASPVNDAGDTTVEIAAAGGRWIHIANALGDLPQDTPARDRLADFVDDVERGVRHPSGPKAEEYAPSALAVLATPVRATPDLSADVAPWPAGAHVRLSQVGSCATVRDPAVVRALTTRTETFYREGGTTYALAAVVALPGDSCPARTGS
jgi:hypothetical protein